MNIVCKDYDPKSWSCQTCQMFGSLSDIISVEIFHNKPEEDIHGITNTERFDTTGSEVVDAEYEEVRNG